MPFQSFGIRQVRRYGRTGSYRCRDWFGAFARGIPAMVAMLAGSTGVRHTLRTPTCFRRAKLTVSRDWQ